MIKKEYVNEYLVPDIDKFRNRVEEFLLFHNVPLDKYVYNGYRKLELDCGETLAGYEFLYICIDDNEKRTIYMWYEYTNGVSCEGHPFINAHISFTVRQGERYIFGDPDKPEKKIEESTHNPG